MATITLNYDIYNVQAQKALENFLALGLFKLNITKTTDESFVFSPGVNEDEFVYFASEPILAKDWLNQKEDEAWKNL